MSCGIYKITNKINGKIYVGSSKNIEKRFKRHLWELRDNKHHNLHLQRSFNKYGEASFQLSIIESVKCEKLIEREQYYLDILQPYNNGFNIGKEASGGDNLTYNPNREKIIQKMTNAVVRRYANMTQEEKDAHSKRVSGSGNSNWRNGGKRFSKCNICGKQIFRRNKTCKICLNRSNDKNPFYGKHHSEKTKQLLSIKKKAEGNVYNIQKIAVIIDGVEYSSASVASKHINCTCTTIMNRVRSSKFPNYLFKRQQECPVLDQDYIQ